MFAKRNNKNVLIQYFQIVLNWLNIIYIFMGNKLKYNQILDILMTKKKKVMIFIKGNNTINNKKNYNKQMEEKIMNSKISMNNFLKINSIQLQELIKEETYKKQYIHKIIVIM